ncbi:cytochrome P450 [Armillaria mellea]|nr:cytochrome P450 [Armillaria mellea]
MFWMILSGSLASVLLLALYFERKPPEEIFRNPRLAYESALKKHGPVIGVYRKSCLEFIVNEQYTAEVLTNDAAFSFEGRTLTVLNLKPLLLLPRSFIRDINKVVSEGLVPSMSIVIEKSKPVCLLCRQNLLHNYKKLVPVDLSEAIHKTLAEAMLTIIFGEAYTTLANIRAAERIAADIAVLSGIYQNLGYWSRTFATTWRIFTWMTLIDVVWILGLTLGAVVIIWVIFEVAVRPEDIFIFRAELNDVLEVDADNGRPTLTYSSLKNAERLDSFIREVLRTKGDTLSTIRLTTRDVAIGGYIIPKGTNQEYHGEDAEQFMSDRWVGRGKPAVMLSPNYWPFGLGRFACPGRMLAVAEINMAVFMLIERATPSLEGDKYKIIDPLNITSMPPAGQLLLRQVSPSL